MTPLPLSSLLSLSWLLRKYLDLLGNLNLLPVASTHFLLRWLNPLSHFTDINYSSLISGCSDLVFSLTNNDLFVSWGPVCGSGLKCRFKRDKVFHKFIVKHKGRQWHKGNALWRYCKQRESEVMNWAREAGTGEVKITKFVAYFAGREHETLEGILPDEHPERWAIQRRRYLTTLIMV